MVLALERADGTFERIETGAHAIYDVDRDEVVMAFRDSMHADEIARILVGDVRRAEQRPGL